LKPFHDSIVELRGKNASYAAIADLLMQNGIKTSRARVAEYGRIVLEGGKSRKRRKRARTAPAVAVKPTPATPAPTVVLAGSVTPPPKEDSPYRSRGPHIANVRMMSPEEAKEFNESLKPKPPAS
jgi:predicted sugar kinase